MTGKIPYTDSCPHEVDWSAIEMADLDEHERGRLIYRVAAEVSRGLDAMKHWRTQRSGTCIGVWFGPRRQAHRPADYYVWIESTKDQHLHRIIAADIYRAVRELMRDYGDPERDIIAAMPFGASLDQIMVEKYGLTEKYMAEPRDCSTRESAEVPHD